MKSDTRVDGEQLPKGQDLPRPPTAFERYAKGADEIQKRCACIRLDARECYEARHYPICDDLDEGRPDWDDDDCCCSCHDELRELEEEVYGPRDD